MSIDSIKKENNDQTRYWQNVQAKEKKLAAQNHENAMNKIKEVQRAETDQLRDEHRYLLAAEKDRQEIAINRVREELDRTTESLSKQKEFLTDQAQKLLADKRAAQEIVWQNTEKSFEEKIADQAQRQKDVAYRANQTFNDEQTKQILSHKDALNDLEEQHKQQLTQKAAQLNTRTSYESKLGEDTIRNLKREKQKQLANEDQQWRHKIQVNNVTNEVEMQRQEKAWKKNFMDQVNAHQSVYQDTLSKQMQEMKNQEDLFEKEKIKLKNDVTDNLEHVENRTSDPFYQIEDSPLK